MTAGIFILLSPRVYDLPLAMFHNMMLASFEQEMTYLGVWENT